MGKEIKKYNLKKEKQKSPFLAIPSFVLSYLYLSIYINTLTQIYKYTCLYIHIFIIKPALAESTLFSHSEWIANYPNAKFVQGYVNSVSQTENKVILSDGSSIEFNYLVIATGGFYEQGDFKANLAQKTRQSRLETLKQNSEKLKRASKILIIGGGAVGTELAGEISTDFPDKKVTLVHRGSVLTDNLLGNPKPGELAASFLASKGVNLVFNDSVSKEKYEAALAATSISTPTLTTLTTEKGATIEADAVFWAVPYAAKCSSLIQDAFPNAIDPATKEILVDQFFRVQGSENIFAAGDVAKVEAKNAFRAGFQGKHIASNLLVLAKTPSGKLKPYKPGNPVGVVSLGRTYGVGTLPLFGTVKGWIPTSLKSKDMMIPKLKQTLGFPKK